MTFTDKNIIENYFGLFESLNSMSKLELIEKLTKSLTQLAVNHHQFPVNAEFHFF